MLLFQHFKQIFGQPSFKKWQKQNKKNTKITILYVLKKKLCLWPLLSTGKAI